MTMHYADYKTILSPNNGMNLYRGCTHGCIYCDSRSACYQMRHAFEDVEVKRNAAGILEAQLRRKRKPCMVGTGAMCDPYLHLESELELTRECLRVVERCGFGLAIQTKSARVLRDLELFKRIAARAKCVVQMTLTTYDETLCRLIEPHVSTTGERFRALEALRAAGIPTVVWISPLLPFLNDTEENLYGLLDYCVRAGVRGVIFYPGLTLREGNREYFYACLDTRFPGMKARYIRQFGLRYACDSPNSARLNAIVREECQKHGILCGNDAVFAYLRRFEAPDGQLTLDLG